MEIEVTEKDLDDAIESCNKEGALISRACIVAKACKRNLKIDVSVGINDVCIEKKYHRLDTVGIELARDFDLRKYDEIRVKLPLKINYD